MNDLYLFVRYLRCGHRKSTTIIAVLFCGYGVWKYYWFNIAIHFLSDSFQYGTATPASLIFLLLSTL